MIDSAAVHELLNGQARDVFEHMLGRLPDENAINDLIQRADKSSSDNRYMLFIQQRFLNKIHTNIGSLFSYMVGEKSNNGVGAGLSADDDEEEEVRLTINNVRRSTLSRKTHSIYGTESISKRVPLAPFPFILVSLTRGESAIFFE